MTLLDSHRTVADLVTEQPGRARVFTRLGIDYCCGGKRPLDEVAAERGLDLEQVLREVADADAPRPGEPDPAAMSLSDLADHIESTHHVFLKRLLPQLRLKVNRVAEVHGAAHPELADVVRVFAGLSAELMHHMQAEERQVFPAIRRLEQGGSGSAMDGSIAQMVREHDSAGEALASLRELTGDFAVPADACVTYIAMLHDLSQLESDLHQHVHKENNILFPRALHLQEQAAAS